MQRTIEKYGPKNRNQLITLKADSLEDWARYCAQRLEADGAWGSLSIGTDPYVTGFAGSESLAEAVSMIRDGWPEGTRRLLRELEASPAPEVASLTPAWEYDVGGEVPDVGLYCAGVPEHMVTPGADQCQAPPVVRLAVLGGMRGSVDADEAQRFAIALASHLDALQRSGRSVELAWVYAVTDSNSRGARRTIAFHVPVAAPSRPVSLERIAAAFHPCNNRRLAFAARELEPTLRGAMRDNYGAPTMPPAGLTDAPIIHGPNGAEGRMDSVEDAAAFIGEELERVGVLGEDNHRAAA